MLLSVIVPVYNGEKYLSECLKSLSNQGLNEQDYEVIVVNDGSTDGTEIIIDSFSQSPQFKKINKVNGGVSSARNLGIETSLGDYITFVDADDMISENIYSPIMEYILQNDLDGYYFGIMRDVDKTQLDISVEDICKQTMICKTKGPGGIHGVIYKKSILTDNHILFNTSMTNTEDLMFNFYFTQCTRRVGCTQLPFYLYRTNDGSVTAKLFQKKTAYGDCSAREYKCYTSFITFLTKINEYRKIHPQNELCAQLMSVMTAELLWTGMRSFYSPKQVLADIDKNGLLLTDIKFKYVEGNTFKERLKSMVKCLCKNAMIYKIYCFAYRKLKDK